MNIELFRGRASVGKELCAIIDKLNEVIDSINKGEGIIPPEILDKLEYFENQIERLITKDAIHGRDINDLRVNYETLVAQLTSVVSQVGLTQTDLDNIKMAFEALAARVRALEDSGFTPSGYAELVAKVDENYGNITSLIAKDIDLDNKVSSNITQIVKAKSDIVNNTTEINHAKTQVLEALTNIGELTRLTTTAKDNLVNAINEIGASGGGGTPVIPSGRIVPTYHRNQVDILDENNNYIEYYNLTTDSLNGFDTPSKWIRKTAAEINLDGVDMIQVCTDDKIDLTGNTTGHTTSMAYITCQKPFEITHNECRFVSGYPTTIIRKVRADAYVIVKIAGEYTSGPGNWEQDFNGAVKAAYFYNEAEPTAPNALLDRKITSIQHNVESLHHDTTALTNRVTTLENGGEGEIVLANVDAMANFTKVVITNEYIMLYVAYSYRYNKPTVILRLYPGGDAPISAIEYKTIPVTNVITIPNINFNMNPGSGWSVSLGEEKVTENPWDNFTYYCTYTF